MITKFRLVDGVGEVIGTGEIENTDSVVYRLFSSDFPNGYKEFETLEAMFAASAGVAIQPEMFLSAACTRQLRLFDELC